MKGKNTRIWESPLLWLIGLVVFAIVATVLLSMGDDTDTPPVSDDPETAFAELLGSPLPLFGEPDVAAGLTAPGISAQTLDGQRVQVAPDGTARLYAFFAHWCGHCRAELPRVSEWLRTNDLPAGVEVVAISTAVEPSADNYPPSAWFAREQWPAEVLLDDDAGTLATGFGLTQFPYWVAVDGDGVVVTRDTGELSTAEFEALVASVTPAAG